MYKKHYLCSQNFGQKSLFILSLFPARTEQGASKAHPYPKNINFSTLSEIMKSITLSNYINQESTFAPIHHLFITDQKKISLHSNCKL